MDGKPRHESEATRQGETVSVAICLSRTRGPVVTTRMDESPVSLWAACSASSSTLDLLKVAVHQGLLPQGEARAGYEKLRGAYRFSGPPWP